jgi:hypothetical protein
VEITAMTAKQKRHQRRVVKKRTAAVKKRNRARALPSPLAYAFTILDAQSMGAPGKSKLYLLDKKLKEQGKQLLFRDAAGRTMVNGDILRQEILRPHENEVA